MGTKRPGVETIIAAMKGLYERRQGPDGTGPHAGVYKWVARSFRWPPVDDMETERHVLLMTRQPRTVRGPHEARRLPRRGTAARRPGPSALNRIPRRSVNVVAGQWDVVLPRMKPGLLKNSPRYQHALVRWYLLSTCWWHGTHAAVRCRRRITVGAEVEFADTVQLRPVKSRFLQRRCSSSVFSPGKNITMWANLLPFGALFFGYLRRKNSGHFSNFAGTS